MNGKVIFALVAVLLVSTSGVILLGYSGQQARTQATPPPQSAAPDSKDRYTVFGLNRDNVHANGRRVTVTGVIRDFEKHRDSVSSLVLTDEWCDEDTYSSIRARNPTMLLSASPIPFGARVGDRLLVEGIYSALDRSLLIIEVKNLGVDPRVPADHPRWENPF